MSSLKFVHLVFVFQQALLREWVLLDKWNKQGLRYCGPKLYKAMLLHLLFQKLGNFAELFFAAPLSLCC